MAEYNITKHSKGKLRAFELRFKGYPYEKIAQDPDVRYTSNTLEAYFSKNGRWYEEYRHWVDWKKEQIEEAVKDTLIAQAHDAARSLINISKGVPFQFEDGDGIKRFQEAKTVHLQANQDILDRSGLVVIKKVEVENKPEDVAEETLKRIEQRKQERLAQKKSKKKKKNDK